MLDKLRRQCYKQGKQYDLSASLKMKMLDKQPLGKDHRYGRDHTREDMQMRAGQEWPQTQEEHSWGGQERWRRQCHS